MPSVLQYKGRPAPQQGLEVRKEEFYRGEQLLRQA